MNRLIPVIILAGTLLLDAILCGFASGAILISTSVAFYQGWAGITITKIQSTPVAIAGLPTYIPFPTYTSLPTYTLLPTYTTLPTFTPAVEAFQLAAPSQTQTLNADVGVTPAAPLQPTSNGQTITYVVQAGDTLETIAKGFDIPVEMIIQANSLSTENPQIQVGDVLKIPLPASTVLTNTPFPTATAGATRPANAPPTPQSTQAASATATPSPTGNAYPGITGTPYPGVTNTPYP